jgi:hypothetical protein
MDKLPLRPISVWVDDRARDGQSEHTLMLYFLARPEELEALTDFFNSSLSKIEQTYDTHVQVKGLTSSELKTSYSTQTNTLGEAILIDGVPPAALLEPSRDTATKATLKSHDEHDARARRLALAIATKIKRDPGLIRLAEERLKRRATQASPRERRELAEWMRALVTMSSARLRKFLLEDNERAIRLRQSLPALSLLSSSERDAVIHSHTDADVISCHETEMTRAELEHAIRAACDATGDDEVYVFGSQAILGQYPDAPETLRQSAEADIAPVTAVDKVDVIDVHLRELSPFHIAHGFYVHGVSIETAVVPNGWQGRAIAVRNDNTRNTTGLCVEAHDLAVSKLVAFRDKDRDLVRVLIVETLIDPGEAGPEARSTSSSPHADCQTTGIDQSLDRRSSKGSPPGLA